MNIRSTDFCVPGGKVDLHKWPTMVAPLYKSKEQYREVLADHVAGLSSQQQLLYASNRYAVLLIFQAMDAAGKDGAIKHVMSGVNPQGCQVFSFKHPSPEELQHDFLWRTTRDLPERGHIGIFNRSYYEEVLIVRVHPEILPRRRIAGCRSTDKRHLARSLPLDRGLERHLHATAPASSNSSCIFRRRSSASVSSRASMSLTKNWKFSLADVEEREYWKRVHEGIRGMP